MRGRNQVGFHGIIKLAWQARIDFGSNLATTHSEVLEEELIECLGSIGGWFDI